MSDGAGGDGARRWPGWPGPGGSMSLLGGIMRDALDPGYREAARREGQGDPRPRRSTRLLLLTSVVLAGLLFSIAVVQLHREKPAAEKQRDRLIAEIRRRTARTDQLQRDLAELRRRTERLRASRLRQSASGARTQRRLTRLEVAAAALPVQGPGLEVTVDDARIDGDEPGAALTDPGRVLDRDLQLVVNGLWAARAEAVSVDGQRLTSLSAIRSAGAAILVDYRPVDPPYTIDAVGDPDLLETRFADSPAGRQLRTLQSNFGIRYTIRREDDLTLPGASGLSLRYARGAADRQAEEDDS